MEKDPSRMMSQIMDILSSQVSLEWKRCTDLPVQMRNAQAVLLEDKLYVGGGLTQKKLQKDEAKLYVYSPTSDTWGVAIDTPTYWFALVVYQSRLVLVGGREYHDFERPGPLTNKLWTLNELNSLCQEIPQLPPMITKRHSASAISHADYLLVAGGHYGSETATLQEEDGLQDVEVFDGQQWATTQPLPKPCWHMKSVMFEENWCLTGGYGQENEVYYVSLDSLIAYRHHSTATSMEVPWKKLPDTPNALSSLVMLQGNKLMAIGGEATADVCTYSCQSEAWLPVKSDLQGAVSNACTILLPTGEVLVIGGERRILEYLNSVYKATPIVTWKDVCEFVQQTKSLGLATPGHSFVLKKKTLLITENDGEQKQLQKGHITDSVISNRDSTLKDEGICELEDDIASLTVSDEMKDEATGEPKPLVHDVSMDKKSIQPMLLQPSTESWDLYGVENLEGGEKTVVVYSSEAKHVHWVKFGLKLHFPKDSLPLGMEQCIIKVKASLAGQYKFPDNSYPVSAVFWLRCEAREFNRPVTVEIQHCAKSDNVSKLSFAKALCNQPQLPYTFKHELGGSFNNHSSYGVIKMNSFSGIVITQTGTMDKEYCSKLFYLDEHSQTDSEVHFVMTWNTEAHLTGIEDEYKKRGARVGPTQSIEFESDMISLDIPMEGVTPSSGCTITPLTRPIITRKEMDRYEPGKHTPCLHLKIDFVISGRIRRLPPLKHIVNLLGARYPHDLFVIDLPARALKRSGNSTGDLPSSKISRSESSTGEGQVRVGHRRFSVDSTKSLSAGANLITGLDTKLDIKIPWHHQKATEYLQVLDNDQIQAVGGALGLAWRSLMRIATPREMVVAWLNRQDLVMQTSGQPTWQSLVNALRKQGQEGIARDIEKNEK